MKLLAISGGPDSMFLLNEYKKAKIMVAHVNYNLRSSSQRDQKIVEDFCKVNNIKLEVLNVKDKPQKNLENWSREIRYNFFAKIYKEYECKQLLTAHHKDDFLETAIMQQRKKRFPRFFGIRKKIFFKNMNVVRPFVNLYWKEDILKEVKKQKVPFGIDETNFDLTFFRNKVRQQLKSLSLNEKNDQFKWFKMVNKILIKKFHKVDAFYRRWQKLEYNLNYFNELRKYKEEIIFIFIHQNLENIKLSSKKIISIIDFINGKNGDKKFFLNQKHFLFKKNGSLKVS